jgi:diguanylate cyclase (GGDEF)-like protein
MHTLIIELQRRAARWRMEHVQVASAVRSLNLQRTQTVAPWVAAVNLMLSMWLGFDLVTLHDTTPVIRWKAALLMTHVLMGLSFVALAWGARQLRYATHSWLRSQLPLLMAGLAMVFCVGIVSVDQWMTPNITPFVTALVAVSMVVYWTPSISVVVFAAIYGLFFYAIGLTQSNPEILLSNRINGLVAVVVGWILSVVLWRNFIAVSLQQAQLEAANAELQTKQKELQRLTRLDGLTGLYNRNTFVDLTRQELARAQRQGSSTTILLLDLDFFKHVNDTWGHPAGDAVLKNVATVANASVRATDLVGRLGGEEFIILLPNTTLEAARKLAEKLRSNLECSPTPWDKRAIACTVSIGVASTTAAEKRDFDHLYTFADKALYTAKEKGRNRVE